MTCCLLDILEKGLVRNVKPDLLGKSRKQLELELKPNAWKELWSKETGDILTDSVGFVIPGHGCKLIQLL